MSKYYPGFYKQKLVSPYLNFIQVESFTIYFLFFLTSLTQRSIYVCLYIGNSFKLIILVIVQYSVNCTHHNLFIHSTVDGHCVFPGLELS